MQLCSSVRLRLYYNSLQHYNTARAEDKYHCISIDIITATDDELLSVTEQVLSSKEMEATVRPRPFVGSCIKIPNREQLSG